MVEMITISAKSSYLSANTCRKFGDVNCLEELS